MKESIENQVLGIDEPIIKQNDIKDFFTSDKKFRIKNVGAESFSIVNGSLIKNILPFSKKQEMANGLKNLEYNGFIIEVVEEVGPIIRENRTVEEQLKPKKKKRVTDD